MARMTGRPEIYAILEEDHRKVDALLTEIQSSDDPDEQRRLFDDCRELLDAHARAEQEVFYPALISADPTHELILEAIEEHRIVLRLMSEIARLTEGSDRFLAKCTVLHELVRHHVKEEEREIFPKGRPELSMEDHRKIADDFREARQRHLDRGAPGKGREVEHRAK